MSMNYSKCCITLVYIGIYFTENAFFDLLPQIFDSFLIPQGLTFFKTLLRPQCIIILLSCKTIEKKWRKYSIAVINY